jgi:dihydroorotate dehydrogenase
MLYKLLVRPWLFRADPEAAHERALNLVVSLGRCRIARDAVESLFVVEDRQLRQTVFGIEFSNPVGLATGYDKNALGLQLWPALGFGFVEVGSVTLHSQPGTESPRLFRQVTQHSLINRMGFNNDGADAIAARIPPAPHRIPIGINVGKNREVDLSRVGESYAATLYKLRDRADFFIINVSSPNTPGLRKLQDKELLDTLLAQLHEQIPILVKIAPDLSFDEIDDVVALVQKYGIAGIVATNTTIDHPVPPEGGLSGLPLRARATECIRHVSRQTQGKLPIIGVGGVFTAEDAYEKIRAGASLIEVWTGMIYEGPAIVRNINRGLLRLLARDGFGSIAEAVGTE